MKHSIKAAIGALLAIVGSVYADNSAIVGGLESSYADAEKAVVVIKKYVILGAGLLTLAAGITTALVWLSYVRGSQQFKPLHIVSGAVLTLLLGSGFVASLM